jgi:hemolysin III
MSVLGRVREPFEAWSHAVGAALALAGLVYLLVQAEGARQAVAYAVYGSSLVLLYLASALYHGLPGHETLRSQLHRLDHSAIFLLIAGTYTPPTLLALNPAWGWSLFGVVWGLAAVGVVLRVAWTSPPRRLLTGIYLAMGWLVLVGIEPLVETFPLEAIAWLVAGGLAYTVGAVVYAAERPDPWPDRVGFHGLWHLFVLAGSAFHYVFVAGYVPPP